MTDADVDGAHIRTLLLTFFFRYMLPLVENGHLFIAQPPLYRIEHKKQVHYVYSDAEKDELLKSINGDNVTIQRYKGLGEMNPEQLWETTMNPENRTILQVTIEDAAAADRTFDMLMGSSVPPPKTLHSRPMRKMCRIWMYEKRWMQAAHHQTVDAMKSSVQQLPLFPHVDNDSYSLKDDGEDFATRLLPETYKGI